jgi:hypothetical protein
LTDYVKVLLIVLESEHVLGFLVILCSAVDVSGKDEFAAVGIS